MNFADRQILRISQLKTVERQHRRQDPLLAYLVKDNQRGR